MDTSSSKPSSSSSSHSPSPAPVRSEERRTRDSGLCATNEIPEIPTFCIDNLNSICLGRGTYGVVEKTRYRKSRNHDFRPAAIKYANDSPGHIMTLIREAKIMMALNHDNVVRIYGLYRCARHGRGVVMEYMDCGSMADLIYHRRTIDYSIDHVASWMFQLSSAVDVFHRNDQVHRDLKLQNMLLCDRYRTMKLCDFGTFTNLHQSMTSNRGTPITMAPEVFRCEEYDAKSDIYSIGIIMWQLFSREPPYNVNLSVPGLLYNVATGNLRPTELTCNPIFSAFWKRCWDNDPNVRPSSQECVEYFGYMRDEFPNGHKPLSDSSTNDGAHTPQPRALRLSPTPTSSSGSDSRTPTPSNRLNPPIAPARSHRRTGSDQSTMISLNIPSPSTSAPVNPAIKGTRSRSVASDLASTSGRIPNREAPAPTQNRRKSSEDSRAAFMSMMDDEHLRPIDPDVRDETSMRIFNEHCKVCEDLVQVEQFKKAALIAKHRTLRDWSQHEKHAALLERMRYLEEAIAGIERSSVSTDDDENSIVTERL
uniref:Mitogen-activated protein kinase kinase kinase n=1 Tax=Caenorhabditis japonica TaxID=281687 RepID=A0A8R1HHW1_CAEJA